MPVLHAARQLEAVPALGGCYFDAASSTLMYFEGRTAPVSRPEAGLACKIRRNMDTCAGLHVQQDPDLQGRCRCMEGYTLTPSGVCEAGQETEEPPAQTTSTPITPSIDSADTSANVADASVEGTSTGLPAVAARVALSDAEGVVAAAANSCSAYGISGSCITTSACTNSGKGSVRGFCPFDPADVQCCISKVCYVGSKTGKCKSSIIYGQCKGNYYSGACPGPSEFKCCITSSTSTSSCVHPLRDQSYSNCGNPGEGTHSWTAAPNNWQSDNAIDFCTSVGTNVYAIEDGVICSSCGYGKMYMTFGGKYTYMGMRFTLNAATNQYFYQHLGYLEKAAGASVRKGDFLGTVGDFRSAFPPHLHFAARDGSPVTKINGCSKSG